MQINIDFFMLRTGEDIEIALGYLTLEEGDVYSALESYRADQLSIE